MKPDHSHVAGLELALSTAESMRYASELDAIDTIHAIEHGLSLLIDQAKSAPAEVAQGEAVRVRGHIHCEVVDGMGHVETLSHQPGENSYPLMTVAQHDRIVAALTTPPSPDAELVALLSWLRRSINCTPANDADKCGAWISTKHPMIQRIDAKLASLKGERNDDVPKPD